MASFVYKIFKVFDYFGYAEWYFTGISSWFWAVSELRYLNMAPSWLWCLIYVYVIIVPHIVTLMLIYKMLIDHFIYEPARELLDKQKKKEKAKQAEIEFDRLYEMGGRSCPVLRCMSQSKVGAAAIMGQCPVAMKYEAPEAYRT